MQWGVARNVRRIHIGTMLEEGSGSRSIAFECRGVQRSITTLIRQIGICATLEQGTNSLRMALAGCKV